MQCKIRIQNPKINDLKIVKTKKNVGLGFGSLRSAACYIIYVHNGEKYYTIVTNKTQEKLPNQHVRS